MRAQYFARPLWPSDAIQCGSDCKMKAVNYQHNKWRHNIFAEQQQAAESKDSHSQNIYNKALDTHTTE